MILFASPLEQFEVVSIIALNSQLFSFNWAFTNVSLYALLTLGLIVALHYFSYNELRLVPSRWSVGLESANATVHNLVKDQIGTANELYFPFIYGIFFFVLFSSLIGNVAYSFAIGTSAVVSLGLSVTIFIGVTVLAINKHEWTFFSFFVPGGTPLVMVPMLALVELISYLARALSLGVRLFSNLVAGHTLLKILSGFIYPILVSGPLMFLVGLLPMTLFTALIGLEIAVSFIQAYVFCILTSSYLKDAIDLH